MDQTTIKSRVKEYLGDIPDEQIKLEPTHAMSNKVYIVHAPSDTIIYREYKSMLLVDLVQEFQTFQTLEAAGIAPKLLKAEEAYRLEQCLPGEAMDRPELGDYVVEAARAVA